MSAMRNANGNRILISYPLVMENAVASLYLPKDLTVTEASRLKAMIDALVIPKEKEPA